MLGNGLLVILATLSAQGPEPVGEISGAVGRVLIHRGGQTYQARPGALIAAGDRLETDGGGRAGLLLDESQVVILGPGASATILQGPEGQTLAIDRGEARVTAAGEKPFGIEIGETRAEVRRGILRATSDGSKFRAESGSALIRQGRRPPTRLDQGRELAMPGGSRPVLVSSSPTAWAIRPDDLQFSAGALAQVLPAQEPAPRPGPATVPPTTGTGTGTNTGTLPQLPRPGTTPARPTGPPSDVTDPTRRRPPAPRTPDPAIPLAPEDTDPTRSGPVPPTPEDTDPTRSATGQPPEDAANANNRPYQPIAVSQPASLSSISVSLGSISASSSAASSGALFSDAQQDSRNLAFPGNIHLVTGQTNYLLSDVRLRASDLFAGKQGFYSIGVGASPTSQVSTGLRTGTNLTPSVLRIPQTNAYLVKLDQYGIQDPAINPTTGTAANSGATAVGTFGFLGANPIAPQISGATPLADTRALFNQRLTFALGEFKIGTQGNNPVLSVRQSDQDRQIIKANPTNDNLDKVTRNPNVNFTQIQDAKFFPDVPKVFVPAPNTIIQPTVKNPPAFAQLDNVRRAAATTLLADSLFDYSKRTGQTRFVVDGKVVDIAGYRRPVDPLLRSGHAAPGQAGGLVNARHQAAAAAAARKVHR